MYKFKSFYCTKSDLEMLEFLKKVYGSSMSAVIRRLVIEAFTREKMKQENT